MTERNPHINDLDDQHREQIMQKAKAQKAKLHFAPLLNELRNHITKEASAQINPYGIVIDLPVRQGSEEQVKISITENDDKTFSYCATGIIPDSAESYRIIQQNNAATQDDIISYIKEANKPYKKGLAFSFANARPASEKFSISTGLAGATTLTAILFAAAVMNITSTEENAPQPTQQKASAPQPPTKN